MKIPKNIKVPKLATHYYPNRNLGCLFASTQLHNSMDEATLGYITLANLRVKDSFKLGSECYKVKQIKNQIRFKGNRIKVLRVTSPKFMTIAKQIGDIIVSSNVTNPTLFNIPKPLNTQNLINIFMRDSAAHCINSIYQVIDNPENLISI